MTALTIYFLLLVVVHWTWLIFAALSGIIKWKAKRDDKNKGDQGTNSRLDDVERHLFCVVNLIAALGYAWFATTLGWA